MSDEIEVGSVLAGQAERIPAHPDDEIGLVGTLLAEAVQARGTGKVTVADAYLAPDGCAALDGLGTVLVGQLEMREAAPTEVVNRVQPPTGRLAARLAKATAVASTQAASGPTHSRTRSLVRQLASHHGVQELDRLVEPILHRWIAHLGQAEHRRPGGGLAQRQATRAAGQRQAQQVSATVERTPALDRLGLSGEAVKIESGGKAPQQLFKLIRRERCCVLHLPRIVPTRAGSRTILTPMGRFPPQDLPARSSKHLTFPPVIDPAAPPIRPERHVPNSIANMRRRLTVALAQSLERCPCCATHFRIPPHHSRS